MSLTSLSSQPLVIGTRQSPLAVRQANLVAEALQRYGLQTEIRSFITAGDRFLEGPLREIGDKGLFTKELEEALLNQTIDCAVHSYKDMATVLPEGLIIGAVLPRGDVRDSWISRYGFILSEAPPGTVVGTSSLRRQTQLRRTYPHLILKDMRGNVHTRIRKMHEGEVDGVVLALAGLQRLGVENIITTVLNITQMIPAASQGALAIECRAHDPRTQEILHLIHDVRTHICTTIERSFLHVLDGSCRKPIGGYAFFTNDILHFQGFMASETGERFSKIHAFPLAHESPQDFGRRAGFELLERFHHS